MDYAKAFRVTRAMAGLSQAELAAQIHVDPSMVSLIESGARKPSRETMTRLAKAMGIPFHLLTLLAADADDLRDVGEAEMQRAARSLASLLISSPIKKNS